MKRLILHIGVPKAGSTSLQRYLATHRAELSAAGILYPNAWDYSPDWTGSLVRGVKTGLCRAGIGFTNHLTSRPRNHNNLFHQLALRDRDKHLFSPKRMTFENLQRIILRSREDTIIVSSESLSDAARDAQRLSPIVDLIEATGVEAHIVMFVRPQHLIANSVFSQRTRQVNNTLAFDEFLDHYAATRKRHFADKLAGWDTLTRVKTTTLPFTRSRLAPNLESAFFAAVGLKDRVQPILDRSESEVRNRSPGPLTLEICRLAAERLSNRLSPEADSFGHSKRLDLGNEIDMSGSRLGWNAAGFMGVDNNMREGLRVANAAKNEEIAQQFWGESWDNVFADDYSCDLVPNAVRYSTCSTQGQREIDQVLQDAMRKVGLDPDSFAQGRDPNRVS